MRLFTMELRTRPERKPKCVPGASFLGVLIFGLFMMGCAKADPEAVRLSVDEFTAPDGIVLDTLKEIEAEIDACMEAGGFPEWEPDLSRTVEANGSSLSLPQFSRDGAVLTGYSGDFGDTMRRQLGAGHDHSRSEPEGDADLGEAGPSFVKLLLGDGSERSHVSYDVPRLTAWGNQSRSRAMGGCQGAGYRAILTEDELPGVLAAESLIRDLPITLQRSALSHTEALEEWTACMSRGGIVTESPFRIGSKNLEPGDYATVDENCRNESRLEESFKSGIDRALQDVQAGVHRVLLDLEQISTSVQSRREG